jgi:hypothetical protein
MWVVIKAVDCCGEFTLSIAEAGVFSDTQIKKVADYFSRKKGIENYNHHI